MKGAPFGSPLCELYNVDKVAFSFLLLGNALFLSDAMKVSFYLFIFFKSKEYYKEEAKKKWFGFFLFDNGAPHFLEQFKGRKKMPSIVQGKLAQYYWNFWSTLKIRSLCLS